MVASTSTSAPAPNASVRSNGVANAEWNPALPQEAITSAIEDTPTDDAYVRSPLQDRLLRLQIKNRRKRYLDVHPEYFEDESLELSDPLLYDRLIRRFQTANEREVEDRRKGYYGQLVSNMSRAEAKEYAIDHPDPDSLFTYTRGPNGEIQEHDKDGQAMSREEGQAWWRDEMTQRFLRGDDADFDYEKVDENEKYNDPEEERDIEDAYFDSMSESDYDMDVEGGDRVLTGETGIQDY